MSRFCLLMSRLLLSGWVGASLFFIWVTILVAKSDLSSEVKDMIAIVRFPVIYKFSFGLLVPAYLFHLASFRAMRPCLTRWLIVAFLVPLLLALGTLDYYNIYLPLADMIDPPGMARPMEFRVYHEASERMGGFMWVLGLVTAMMLNWPVKAAKPEDGIESTVGEA